MLHLTAKATTTATEFGQFEAIAAVFGNIDRDGDRIVPGAFSASIGAWKGTGRLVPVHWNHEADPASIIGTIDPASMRETSEGLSVSGVLDIEGSAKAREVWRLVKGGSIGLSFGYLVERKRKGRDGATELIEIDLFEVSITAAPVNANARIVSWKSAKALDGDEQEKAAPPSEYELILEEERLGLRPPELTALRDAAEEHMRAVLTDSDPEASESKAVERKSTAPIRVASFEVE